jgi:hypothetical protein
MVSFDHASKAFILLMKILRNNEMKIPDFLDFLLFRDQPSQAF